MFVFACFVNDAIGTNRITLSTLNQQTKLEDDGTGLVIKHGFNDEQLKADGRNLVLMALASTALATDKAMDIVYGDKNPDDTSELGSARAILYQIRCAFAHDLLVPIWNPKSKYKHTYRVTVNVQRESGATTHRTIELDMSALGGKHLCIADFGNFSGYLGLLEYCFQKVHSDPNGNTMYSPPVED